MNQTPTRKLILAKTTIKTLKIKTSRRAGSGCRETASSPAILSYHGSCEGCDGTTNCYTLAACQP